MPQIIPVTEEQDATLMGIAKDMATGMENGTRQFIKYFNMDSGGNIVFQRLGNGVVRALVSVRFGTIVGYSGLFAVVWDGKKNTVLPSFREDSQSIAYSISQDIRTIVGYSNGRPVVWDRNVPSYLPVPGDAEGSARKISANGSKIVGESNGMATVWRNRTHEFLERPSSDHIVLSVAQGISDDMENIVGYEDYVYPVLGMSIAILWSNGTRNVLPGFSGITNPDDMTENESTVAYAVSSNGEIIVGHSQRLSIGVRTAVRWFNGALEALPETIEPGMDESFAFSCSSDGLVIVGNFVSSRDDIGIPTTSPCFWSGNIKTVLPTLDGFASGTAWEISDDKRVIIGSVQETASSFAMPVKWIDGEIIDLANVDNPEYGQALGISR